MDRDNQFAVRSVNHHPIKIDVMKFDGTNNFELWKCEVMEALTTSNFDDALRLKEKSEETSENVTPRLLKSDLIF